MIVISEAPLDFNAPAEGREDFPSWGYLPWDKPWKNGNLELWICWIFQVQIGVEEEDRVKVNLIIDAIVSRGNLRVQVPAET